MKKLQRVRTESLRGVTVHDILTLIDDVDELFFRAVEMGKDISEYLPYVSDEGFQY